MNILTLKHQKNKTAINFSNASLHIHGESDVINSARSLPD